MTDKPNYNDGNWHGWNGGECPVHPQSEVEAVWHDTRRNTAGITGPRQAVVEGSPTLAWSQVVRFRVIKEYRESRTIWAYGAHLFETEEKAVAFRDQLVRENPNLGYAAWPITEFREVTK